MPRVHYVKKARKDNQVVKAGESYYWWSTRMTVGKSYVSHKHYSKTVPKRSQLTSSDFLSQMYAIEEDVIGDFGSADSVDDLKSAVEDAVQQIRDLGEEQQGKLDNMPEGLQEGPTGEMLQSRYDECDGMADELESVGLEDYEGPEWEPENGKLKNDPPEEFTEWLQGKIDELQGVSYNGE